MIAGMPMISYPSGSTELAAYLAVPGGAQGPWPGVVVVHDVNGFRGDVQAQADRLAERGYLALAPSLFSRGRAPACLVAVMRAAMSGKGQAFDDLEAARRALVARDDCTGKVGIIGFCMGGDFALMSAPRYDFAAAAVNYGKVPKDAERVLAGTCPVVGSYGGKDHFLRGAAKKLDGALTALDVPHDVKEYPGVGHSFLNDLPAVMLSPVNPLNLVMNLRLRDPEAASDAWRRIFAFFDEHLRG
jgi:carboxymethylenebutenolidase